MATEAGEDVSAAMRRVLEAEQASVERLSGCHKEADAVIEAARSKAREIVKRANARIAQVDKRHRAQIDRQVTEIETSSAPSASMFESLDDTTIARAIEALARRLTS